jgi:ssDNA-binding Zn-finger/Zn-ribbon topoisomerase 1
LTRLIFCHLCKKTFLIRKSENKLYVYGVHGINNGKGSLTLEAILCIETPEQICPKCKGFRIQPRKMKEVYIGKLLRQLEGGR